MDVVHKRQTTLDFVQEESGVQTEGTRRAIYLSLSSFFHSPKIVIIPGPNTVGLGPYFDHVHALIAHGLDRGNRFTSLP